MKANTLFTKTICIASLIALIGRSSYALDVTTINDKVSGRIGVYGSHTFLSGHISNILDNQYGAGGQVGIGIFNSLAAIEMGVNFGKTTGADHYNLQRFDGKRNAIATYFGAEYQKVFPAYYIYITPSMGLGIQSYDINLIKGESETNYQWSSVNYHFGLEAAIPYGKSIDATKCLTIRFDYAPSIDQKNTGSRYSFKIGASIFGWLASAEEPNRSNDISNARIEQPCNLRRGHEIIDSMLSANNIETKRDADMIQFHHGLGMWIRNKWGLWGGKTMLQPVFIANNLTQPDEQSAFILDTYQMVKISPANADSLYKTWSDISCNSLGDSK